MIIATTTPAHHHLTDHDDDDESVPNGHSQELDPGDVEYPDPVDGMTTHAEKNLSLQSKLKVINHESKVLAKATTKKQGFFSHFLFY